MDSDTRTHSEGSGFAVVDRGGIENEKEDGVCLSMPGLRVWVECFWVE